MNSREFRERCAALQLVQLATENQDIDIGADDVERLINLLEVEAPPQVLESMGYEGKKDSDGMVLGVKGPPSPPTSSIQELSDLSQVDRSHLRKLQELINRRLGEQPNMME